VLEIL